MNALPMLASAAADATVAACPLVRVAVPDIVRAVTSRSDDRDDSSPATSPTLASNPRTKPSNDNERRSFAA